MNNVNYGAKSSIHSKKDIAHNSIYRGEQRWYLIVSAILRLYLNRGELAMLTATVIVTVSILVE